MPARAGWTTNASPAGSSCVFASNHRLRVFHRSPEIPAPVQEAGKPVAEVEPVEQAHFEQRVIHQPIQVAFVREEAGVEPHVVAGLHPIAKGQVTPKRLFRGSFPGETVGPYISQLLITPTKIGAQEIYQQLTTYVPGVDYLTDLSTWFQVQNGIDSGIHIQPYPQPCYLYSGRCLSAYTHVDMPYQAYLTGAMVLSTLGVPFNPGNPYIHSKTQNGSSTFGGPDIVALLGEVAAKSLDVVWYQKWVVHLRHRPESGGAIAHLIHTGQQNAIDATHNANVLNSHALQHSFSKNGTSGISRGLPDPPCLSHWTWDGRWCLLCLKIRCRFGHSINV